MSSMLLKLVTTLGRRSSPQRLFLLSKSTSAAAQTNTDSYGKPPKPFSEMPGDKGWPIIGSLEAFKIANGKTGKDFLPAQLFAKYGPIVRIRTMGNMWIVFTTGPEAIEAFFQAEGKYPSRSKLMEDMMMYMHERNNWPAPMLFAPPEEWRRIRSAASKQVLLKRVGNFTSPLCDITDDLLDYLDKINDGKIDNLLPVIRKWIFQSSFFFVFGEKMNVFNESNPSAEEFISAGVDFIQSLSEMTKNPSPFYKYLPSKHYRNVAKATTRLRALAKQVMERKVVQLSVDIARGTVDETKTVGIMEQWLIEGKLEPEDAISLALDLFSAGIETTTNTSTFLLFELAKQPALQDQLCHEIKVVLDDKVNPSLDDLQNIPLVRNCLKETMRLYPPTAMHFRNIQEDAVLHGYHVPAGTVVLGVEATMSHSEEYYNKPGEFIPERWSKDKESMHPFLALPFGFGPRGCYGRRLAELEIFILLTKLIPRFTLSTDKDKIAVFQSTTLMPHEPVPVTIRERASH